jgi:hypothetical protein
MIALTLAVTLSPSNFVSNESTVLMYEQSTITPAVLPILERNLVPDAVIRFGIQRELEMELTKINKLTVEEKAEKNRLFVEELKKLPIAIQQDKGQHPSEELTTCSNYSMFNLSAYIRNDYCGS